MRRKWLGFFVLMFCSPILNNAQAVGGNAVYNFINLPYSAKTSALGGINISSLGNDLGLAMYNPSLLTKDMDANIHLSVKPFYADIQQYDLSVVNYIPNKKIVLGWGVHYLDYGNIPMTDMVGNEMGIFHPNDYSVHISAAMNYKQNFTIGSTIKFIQSNYGLYKSNAMAMDIGLRYHSSNALSQVSILVNNMGVQFKSYLTQESLPFNIIAGWSKKLENAPLQFSITAQKLSVWNNTYNDINYTAVEGYKAPATLQNVFNHLVVASEIYIGEKLNIDIGYNFIRRFDLNVQNQQNFLNGFSTGLNLTYNRMQFQYANSFFQKNAYHHFTVVYSLKTK